MSIIVIISKTVIVLFVNVKLILAESKMLF
jgi:hypothetical protein